MQNVCTSHIALIGQQQFTSKTPTEINHIYNTRFVTIEGNITRDVHSLDIAQSVENTSFACFDLKQVRTDTTRAVGAILR